MDVTGVRLSDELTERRLERIRVRADSRLRLQNGNRRDEVLIRVSVVEDRTGHRLHENIRRGIQTRKQNVLACGD